MKSVEGDAQSHVQGHDLVLAPRGFGVPPVAAQVVGLLTGFVRAVNPPERDENAARMVFVGARIAKAPKLGVRLLFETQDLTREVLMLPLDSDRVPDSGLFQLFQGIVDVHEASIHQELTDDHD